MDIHITRTVQVPQLDMLTQTIREIGEKLVETVDSVRTTLERLLTGQADISQEIATQMKRIADEVAQWTPETVTQEQLDTLGMHLTTAADTAEQQAADIRTNTQAITGIVPDAPPA